MCFQAQCRATLCVLQLLLDVYARSFLIAKRLVSMPERMASGHRRLQSRSVSYLNLQIRMDSLAQSSLRKNGVFGAVEI